MAGMPQRCGREERVTLETASGQRLKPTPESQSITALEVVPGKPLRLFRLEGQSNEISKFERTRIAEQTNFAGTQRQQLGPRVLW